MFERIAAAGLRWNGAARGPTLGSTWSIFKRSTGTSFNTSTSGLGSCGASRCSRTGRSSAGRNDAGHEIVWPNDMKQVNIAASVVSLHGDNRGLVDPHNIVGFLDSRARALQFCR